MKKSTKQLALSGAVGALFLSAGAASAHAVPDQPKNWEKCLGVAKQGKNDCGSTDGRHQCAGQASKDGDPTEWVYVPEGTCERIVGGKVYMTKPAKKA